MPSHGAETDGTAIQPFPAFTTRTFGVAEKPIQTLTEFRQSKAFIPGEAVRPPINPEMIHILFHRGQGLQEVWGPQLTIVA